jgi:hypothetical protein
MAKTDISYSVFMAIERRSSFGTVVGIIKTDSIISTGSDE